MNPTLPPLERLTVRTLGDDVVGKVLEQLIEGTPPEDLCGRLYERCLLLLGSGGCPPNDPIWKQACRRFGLTEKGHSSPRETWQNTFRTFCNQVSILSPKNRALLWRYVRGEGAAVPQEDFLELRAYFTPNELVPWVTGMESPYELDSRQPTGVLLHLVSQALKHFGALSRTPSELITALLSEDQDAVLRLIEGHPRRGVTAMVHAIERSPEMIPALLAAGVPVETMVRDHETLLQYAVMIRNGDAIELLLQGGADQTARNAHGLTTAEVVVGMVLYAWTATGNDESNRLAREILRPLWPEAAAEWLAMSDGERPAAVRDGWVLKWPR